MTTTVPLAERQAWPKLSETLGTIRAPNACQNCARVQEAADDCQPFERWEECDEWDRPTGILVILCRDCARRLIEPHPRLYRSIDRWEPWPGAMLLCVACRFREQLRCIHPSLKANGGPGLEIRFPKPAPAFLCGGSHSGLRMLYNGPPKACAGRQEVE